MDDTSSTLLRLLGIERWVLRPVAAAPARGAAAGTNSRRVDTSGGSAARAGAVRVVPTPRAADAAAAEAPSPRWSLQLDLHVCANVLAVLEQSVAVPQRFVRDICAAISKQHAPLQALEDFAWPPPGRDDLAQRALCRSALMAVLARLRQERDLAAVVLFGPTLVELCSDAGGAAPLSDRGRGMRMLFIADPATLVENASMKRAFWATIQHGPAPAT